MSVSYSEPTVENTLETQLSHWVAQLQQEIGEPEEPFTSREEEIIALIAKGYSSYQIAHALFISKQTVDTHRKNIYRKGHFRCVRDVVVYQLLMELNPMAVKRLQSN